MRNGALAYGLPEPFTETTEPPRGDEFGVSEQTHYRAEIDKSAMIFGAMDTKLHLPFNDNGDAHRLVSIPMSTPSGPVRCMFELEHTDRIARRYRFSGETGDAVWLCPVCGRACDAPEPHTARHGVPGHLLVGDGSSDYASNVVGRSPRIDDPSDYLARGY
jgi:hypothetical protein